MSAADRCNNAGRQYPKIWPVATTILSIDIDTEIPNDVNIFIDCTTKLPRSIDEIVAFMCESLKKETWKEKSTHD